MTSAFASGGARDPNLTRGSYAGGPHPGGASFAPPDAEPDSQSSPAAHAPWGPGTSGSRRGVARSSRSGLSAVGGGRAETSGQQGGDFRSGEDPEKAALLGGAQKWAQQHGLKFHGRGVVFLVAIPWVMFVVVVNTFAFMSNFRILPYFIFLLCLAVSCILIYVHFSQKMRDPYYLFLGGACFFAVVAGGLEGLQVFDYSMSQYYLTRERAVHFNVAPTQLAGSMPDAGVIHFSDAARLDLRRVLGFRPQDGTSLTTYCVAPILDDTQLSQVEFWAVGFDCCEPLSMFRCGDSLKFSARTGMVVSRAASEPIAYQYWRFQQAAQQAAAIYHIRTPREPVFVEWVASASVTQDYKLRMAIINVVLMCALHFMLSIIIAAILHWSASKGQQRAGTFTKSRGAEDLPQYNAEDMR